MRIILASKSSRRKELLELIGLKFETIVSNCEEKMLEKVSIEEKVENLAYQKAKTVYNETIGDRIVIGSDTIVYKDGKIYGKPKTTEEAKKMLIELKNCVHKVITGLCILCCKENEYKKYVLHSTTEVGIKDMNEKEIEDWIKEGKALDRAGAYGIQDSFAKYITSMNGNYFSVMGIPVEKVYDILKELNVEC